MIKPCDDQITPQIADAIRVAMNCFNMSSTENDPVRRADLLQQSIAASLLALATRLEWGIATSKL